MSTIVALRALVDLAFRFLDPVVIAVAVPVATTAMMRTLHIDATSALGQRILTAAENGAALGLSRAQAAADAGSTVNVKSAAVAEAISYVQASVTPKTLAAAGVTPDHLVSIVEAQVAKTPILFAASAAVIGPELPQPVTQETPA